MTRSREAKMGNMGLVPFPATPMDFRHRAAVHLQPSVVY
jgi:hypothetical protein